MKKAIILAAGSGKRMEPITKFINKELLPVFNKKTIFWVIDELFDANFKKIHIVISKNKYNIFQSSVEYIKKMKYFDLEISYSIQEKLNGMAGAIYSAKDFIGNDDFCLALPDNLIFNENIIKKMKYLYEKTNKNILCLTKINYLDSKDYGIVKIENKNEINTILSMEEKPKLINKNNDVAIIGRYILKNEFLKVIKDISFLDAKKEIDITWILNNFAKDKKTLGIFLKGKWIDVGNKTNYLLHYKKTNQKYENYDVKKLEKEIIFNFKKGLL